MGVTTTRAGSAPPVSAPTAATGRLALAVADANWFTTENLFREVPASRADTLLLKCIDYNNAWRRGSRPWDWGRALTKREPGHWQRDLVLPSGWMKRFPRLGMRPIGRSIRRWRDELVGGDPLVLVMTYPHYLYLRDQVAPDRQIYFNIDDYSQYWPRDAVVVNQLERQAVREADLTVCVSALRAEDLRRAVPESAGKIRHLPHGAPSSAIAPRPLHRPAAAPEAIASLPRPLLGYVGTLEERVDWPLLTRLAAAHPGGSLVLVGRLGKGKGRPAAWRLDRDRCLASPNVQVVPWQAQEAIAEFNQAFDVCLIPYRVDDPFNHVCCPTKIMDYMASSRPIVSTDLPECRLSRRLFDVADSHETFLDAVAAILADGSDDGRASDRLAWAGANTCGRVVERLLDWLPS